MIKEALVFNDVMLVPQYSTVKSRSEVDVSVSINGLNFAHPIIPANMKDIMGFEMAHQVIKSGGLAILHRFMSVNNQLQMAGDFIHDYGNTHLAISLGIKAEDRENFIKFVEAGVKIFCIDVAHADSEICLDMVSWLKQQKPDITLIVGNVSTGAAARRLWYKGADVVKVGQGSGTICTTRIETGNGQPQLSAIMEVAEVKKSISLEKCKDAYGMHRPLYFISDGGLRNTGDLVKSLCFADMVMAGGIFAGCLEAPGEIIEIDGKMCKEYSGSSTYKINHVEGVKARVVAKGSFESILTRSLEGLKSGCSYQGAHNLEELKENPQLVRITGAGFAESNAHDVILK